MKKYFFLFLSFALLSACAPDSNSTSSNAAVASPPPATTASAQTGEPVHVESSVLSPYIGMWHYETIAGVKDAKTRDLYAGRWIDLKGDQTFTSGVWQEQNNSGKWDFDLDSKLINLFYDKDEGLDFEFKVNGPSNEIVIFMGNTPKTPRGIQIKMVRYADRELPTE